MPLMVLAMQACPTPDATGGPDLVEWLAGRYLRLVSLEQASVPGLGHSHSHN